MPGPAPKPAGERRRRNAPLANTLRLPAEGRKGKPPAWPLPGRMQAGELDAWRQVWRTPQSVQWGRLGWERTVARYVRVLLEAELPEAVATTRAECRQLEDRLGLTPMAMLRLRWEIVADEVGEARADRSVPAASSRDRLRIVDPAEVAQR